MVALLSMPKAASNSNRLLLLPLHHGLLVLLRLLPLHALPVRLSACL
jgi:hypothetical protein